MTSSSHPQPARRALLAVVGLLCLALVIGGVVVIRELTRPPASANAAPTVRGASSIEAGLEAAQTYQRDRKFAEAAAILDKLAEQAPTDRAVRLSYAQALIGLEKHAEAYKQYEAAISLSGSAGQASLKPTSDGSMPKVERDPALAQMHFEAGTCANVAKLFDRAEEHYYMAQVLDPGEPRYPVYLAMMQIKKGDDAAANASLLRAIKLNPDLAEAWGTLAELALKQNRTGLAAQHIEKARTLQPAVTRWRVVEARVLNRTGEAEKAAGLLQNLPAAERFERSVLTTLSESFGLLKRPADAAALYEQASKAAPTDAELLFETARWFQRAGDTAKARQFAQTAGMLGHVEARELEKQLTSGQ